MHQKRFLPCLNKQRRLYNQTIGSLVGAVLGMVVLGISLGLLYGLGGAAVCFVIGGWIDNEMYRGNIQKSLYWHFPFANDWLEKNIPESSDSREL